MSVETVLRMEPPTRSVNLDRPICDLHRRADGSMILKARGTLGAYPERMTDRLIWWAQHAATRPLFAAREADGAWRTISYGEALQQARKIGTALLDRNLSAERPVVILSGNDLDHAMLALGCMYAGIPYAPISPAYSLVSTDFDKLKQIFALLTPGTGVHDRRPRLRDARSRRRCPATSRSCVSRHPTARPAGSRFLRSCRTRADLRRRRRARASRRPTPSSNSCSPPARPANPRPSSTPTACGARTRRCCAPASRSCRTSRR